MHFLLLWWLLLNHKSWWWRIIAESRGYKVILFCNWLLIKRNIWYTIRCWHTISLHVGCFLFVSNLLNSLRLLSQIFVLLCRHSCRLIYLKRSVNKWIRLITYLLLHRHLVLKSWLESLSIWNHLLLINGGLGNQICWDSLSIWSHEHRIILVFIVDSILHLILMTIKLLLSRLMGKVSWLERYWILFFEILVRNKRRIILFRWIIYDIIHVYNSLVLYLIVKICIISLILNFIIGER